jgi:hypothetical protein
MMRSELPLPNWQAKILNQLDARLGRSFIVEDPDFLLAEENLQKVLLDQGFCLYFYEDPIELRYFLEEKVISEKANCIISVDTDAYELNSLPFDILSQSIKVTTSLRDCFPELSYSVLKALAAEELNALDAALVEYAPGQLNDKASSDFVLRHVFKLAPEVIQTPSDLLKSLLGLHYRDIDLPEILKARLIVLLQKRKQFVAWPLNDIVANRNDFFEFLQLHWAEYVAEIVESIELGIKEPKVVREVRGGAADKVVMPFGHDDVRVYIDNLFLEDYLQPIEVNSPEKLTGHWCLVGVQQDPGKEFKKRIFGLIQLCEETLPSVDDRHQQWFKFAYRWAELASVFHNNKAEFAVGIYAELQRKVDQRFSDWMLSKYAGLHNHPPMPPVMLHHTPRFMARELDDGQAEKVALILIDGLSIDQWVTIRNQLELEENLNETAVFAWVPTVTSVSRQALFSGKAPYQFSKSIHTTSTEPKAWTQFWQDHGLSKQQIYYAKGLGAENFGSLDDQLSDGRLKAVGLVINTVDDMMHGMQLGAAGMHNLVALWAKGGYLGELITSLLAKGFSIHITSDHGNVEATGTGKIREGAIAESRGERTRVYETETLRDSISYGCDEAIAWPQIGLPSNYWPTVMKGRKAFVAENEKIVGHGGISLEEVIVPYITISRELNE